MFKKPIKNRAALDPWSPCPLSILDVVFVCSFGYDCLFSCFSFNTDRTRNALTTFVVRKIVFDDVDVVLKWDSHVPFQARIAHLQFHSITYSGWIAFIMLHKFTSIQR